MNTTPLQQEKQRQISEREREREIGGGERDNERIKPYVCCVVLILYMAFSGNCETTTKQKPLYALHRVNI